MTLWLKRALSYLAALACTLAFLAGFGPSSIAFAQSLETQTDTPALHFRDYGLRSLEPLLTDEARRGLQSGRLRPSLSTFLHPARYGLIAQGDAAYAVSVTELLCLNRANRSLQLACRQEDGTRRTIRLSEAACAQPAPLASLLPPRCRPYVSTIEGRIVAIRRAHRPEGVDLTFVGEGTETSAAPPPQAPEPPTSQTGPPATPAQVRDPPPAGTTSVRREVHALREENARLRRQLNYAIGLPALLFLFVVGYTLVRAARAQKPIPSAQEGPAPDVALDPDESAFVSLRDELSKAKEEVKTVAGRLQRATLERERAERERVETLGNLQTLDQRAGRLADENARLREENATQRSIDEALREQVTQAQEAAEEAERRTVAAERAYADQRQAHAAIEERLLNSNSELLQANARLQRELELQRARDAQAARERAAATDPLHDLPRTTLTQDFSAHAALHQPLGGGEETTRRLSREQLDEARQQAEAAIADLPHPPSAPHDDKPLDFGDLEHDLPTVFDPTRATNETPTAEPKAPVDARSEHEKKTRAHPACPQLRQASRRDDEAGPPLRGKTTEMPAAQRDAFVAATRQPRDGDQEPTRRDRDSLHELSALTQAQQERGVWPRTDDGDRTSIPPPPPAHTGEQGTMGEA